MLKKIEKTPVLKCAHTCLCIDRCATRRVKYAHTSRLYGRLNEHSWRRATHYTKRLSSKLFFKCQQIFWCHVISYHFQGTPLVLLFQQCCLRLACTEENISYQNVIKIYGMYIHICQICHIQKYRWHTSMHLFKLFWWFIQVNKYCLI